MAAFFLVDQYYGVDIRGSSGVQAIDRHQGFKLLIINVIFYHCIADGTKVPAAGEQSLASSSLRPHLNALRPPRTPSHTSLGVLPATSGSKLSRKSLGRIGMPHKGAGSSHGETCAGL